MTGTGDVYLDEPWVSIRWDGVHKYVHSEWRTFATSAEFRAALLIGVRAIRERRATSYLSDTRKVKVIVPDDQKWIKETWLPLAFEAGLKHVAFVTAPTGLGQMTVRDAATTLHDSGLQSRTFDSVAAATRWIEQVQVKP